MTAAKVQRMINGIREAVRQDHFSPNRHTHTHPETCLSSRSGFISLPKQNSIDRIVQLNRFNATQENASDVNHFFYLGHWEWDGAKHVRVSADGHRICAPFPSFVRHTLFFVVHEDISEKCNLDSDIASLLTVYRAFHVFSVSFAERINALLVCRVCVWNVKELPEWHKFTLPNRIFHSISFLVHGKIMCVCMPYAYICGRL